MYKSIFKYLSLLVSLSSLNHSAHASQEPDSIYNRLVGDFYKNLHTNQKRATEINDSIYALFKEEKNKIYLYSFYHNNAYIHYINSDYAGAVEYFDSSYTVTVELKDSLKMTGAIMNKGAIFYTMNKYADALECYLKSGELMQKHSPKQLPGLYGNIGMLYTDIENYDKAIYYLELSIELNTKNDGAPEEQIKPLNVLGIIYKSLGNYAKSKQYYHVALKLAEESGDKYTRDLGDIHTNLAAVEQKLGNTKQQYYHLAKSLEKYEITGNKDGLLTAKTELSKYYLDQNELIKAEKNILEAYDLAKSFDIPIRYKMELPSLYAGIYARKGNYNKAYEYMTEAFLYKDSLHKHMNLEEASKMELQFDFNLKATLDSIQRAEETKILELKLAEEKAINDAKLSRQRIFTAMGLGGTAFLLVFAFVLYKAYRNKTKANHFIHRQKEIIEDKQREILDSINYAERIQRSFLATQKLLDENLKDYFVFFQPKDVVSGDFYWASTIKTTNGNHFCYVTADSTGHGVPGAIMSIVNIACLKEAVTKGLTNPDEILNETRRLVIDYLKNDGSSEGGKDGMDCSLVIINPERTKLVFAAAQSPVWIFRKGELMEFRPDKMPVGKHDNDQYPFALQSVDLERGDVIYTLTDGFADQFGGDKGKKFMYKSLKELLIKIAEKPMAEQNGILENTFGDWKGNLEQVDDICIIGVRI